MCACVRVCVCVRERVSLVHNGLSPVRVRACVCVYILVTM